MTVPKALLVLKGVDFPKTHDVDYLLSECQKVTSGVLERVDLKSLTDYGVAARYPDDFCIPDPSETMHYIQVAKEIQQIVKRLLE